MRINVSQQLKSAIGSRRSYKIKDTVAIAGGDSPVEGEAVLVRTDRGILVEAKLRTSVELICSRCLTPFQYPITLNIAEEYLPTADIVSGAPLDLPDEPGSFAIGKSHVLSLVEAIRQHTLLAVPMKPLCRRDCAGLCPTCGHNLNKGRCHCPVGQADPRWAKLQKLASAKSKK